MFVSLVRKEIRPICRLQMFQRCCPSPQKQLEELNKQRNDLLGRLHKVTGSSSINSLTRTPVPTVGDTRSAASSASEMQSLAMCVADSMAATYCTVSLAKHMELGECCHLVWQ